MTYRLHCAVARLHVRVRVQVPQGSGWHTTGIESTTVRQFSAWRAELEEWAASRGITLLWCGPAVERQAVAA